MNIEEILTHTGCMFWVGCPKRWQNNTFLKTLSQIWLVVHNFLSYSAGWGKVALLLSQKLWFPLKSNMLLSLLWRLQNWKKWHKPTTLATTFILLLLFFTKFSYQYGGLLYTFIKVSKVFRWKEICYLVITWYMGSTHWELKAHRCGWLISICILITALINFSN